VTFRCACGGTMRRTPELIDVWFDSGAMPFAQWHYPFENKELIDSGEQYPADFICEGVDQTRGWFYSLHAIGTFLFNKPAYKNLIVNELILDKDGQKMSKSRGNTVNPFDIIARYGADTTRWYLVTSSPPWRPTMFDIEGLGDVQRRFFGTLVNTYAFFAMYANIDQLTWKEPEVPVSDRPEIDRWILSELHSLLGRYRGYMEAYDVTKAARSISDFTVDSLSNWYVRRNRWRFWKSEMGRDKVAAYQTLYTCLTSVAKLMAPFAPFLADEIFRNLNIVTGRETAESVHLAWMPEADSTVVDAALEERMARAQRIVMVVRAMRMKANLKVRQPLRQVILPVPEGPERDDIRATQDIILDEINVKSITYVSDESGIVRKKAKPNFKTLGPKFGKAAQQVATRIKEMTPAEISSVERNGGVVLVAGDQEWTVATGDVEVIREEIQGWVVETEGGLTVALDTRLDDELIAEGCAREFINRVQNMRKSSGFEVTDRIAITYTAPASLGARLESQRAVIMRETLADAFGEGPGDGEHAMAQDINGEEAHVAIARVRRG
jgi:isoleucyl-tRNA synthetase